MKWILSIFMIIAPIQLSQQTATKEQGLLIYGDDLTMMFFVTPLSDDQVALRTIPANTIVPATCASNKVVALSSIQDDTCLRDTINNAFPIEITNTIQIHTKQIEEDFTITKPAKQLTDFHEMQDYFDALGSQLSISLLWKFHTYVTTDLSIQDMIRYYQIYTADKFGIQYYFLHLLSIDPYHTVAIDHNFYQDSKRSDHK